LVVLLSSSTEGSLFSLEMSLHFFTSFLAPRPRSGRVL
jgi:hypothetical protein